MILKNSIEKLMRRQNLDGITCQQVLHAMLAADADPLQTAAFLVLLRAKTETVEELVGILSALKQHMVPVLTPHRVLDIVGTGGDGANSINISTGSAILAASCGIKVAKHGNRAVSSLTGTADVLEALGIAIDLSPEKVSTCINEVGIGFCYFQNFHPAALKLRSLGKQLKVPTALNFLGTLLNPTNPAHYLLGVFDQALLPVIAETLQQMGTERSVIVHGCGLDEISCAGPAEMIHVTRTEIEKSTITPEMYGLPRCTVADLRGGDATVNAQILLATFAGKRGAIADTLILNVAVALYLYGLYPSIAEGVAHAKESLYSGAALRLLKQWKDVSHD